MNNKDYLDSLRTSFESYMHQFVGRIDLPVIKPFHDMMSYHMGWSGDGSGKAATGKRIRPMLLLLCHASNGCEPSTVFPAATAVELIHNFSLIHDDIEDDSPTRRGRTTVWKNWGIPQAINTGDGLFALANLALLQLDKRIAPETIIRSAAILLETCLELTQGQFLDMSFEKKPSVSLDSYWGMIHWKTASLISTSTMLGAILAGADQESVSDYQAFGKALGLAFQVVDDTLGIWGDEDTTGKSALSDLITHKKTIPVLYGLEHDEVFTRMWCAESINNDDCQVLSKRLEEIGARKYARDHVTRLTNTALAALEKAEPQGFAGETLFDMTKKLSLRVE